ncbi:hypothetical protein M758_2G214700 [Ceratodon purpureus]|nr:hypothetical protein M758_2G214700 [Ceratodon purpureus]
MPQSPNQKLSFLHTHQTLPKTTTTQTQLNSTLNSNSCTTKFAFSTDSKLPLFLHQNSPFSCSNLLEPSPTLSNFLQLQSSSSTPTSNSSPLLQSSHEKFPHQKNQNSNLIMDQIISDKTFRLPKGVPKWSFEARLGAYFYDPTGSGRPREVRRGGGGAWF